MQFSVTLLCSGIPDRSTLCQTTYDDIKAACENAGLPIDETEPGDSEYAYLADECSDTERSEFWQEWKENVQDLFAGGIIDREAFDTLVTDLGARANSCETMGTLGGPLGHYAPDVSFEIESTELIVCMRATPIAGTVDEPLGRCPWPERQGLLPIVERKELLADYANRVGARLRDATVAVYG